MSTKTKTHRVTLKPCPFCGSKPKTSRIVDHGPELPEPFWSVACSKKPCHGDALAFGDTRREAIQNWNRRRSDFDLHPIKGDDQPPFLGVNGTLMMCVESIEEMGRKGSGVILIRGLILAGFHFNDRGNYEKGQTVTIGPITDTWRRLTPA